MITALFVLFTVIVLAIGGSVIYTDLTYPWKPGTCRNPVFHHLKKYHKRGKK